eukprot:s100_g15.t1
MHSTFHTTLPEVTARETLASYAGIYIHGFGRWDKSTSCVDGLITYAVRSCLAVCVFDSSSSPSRASLLHGPMANGWANRVADEVKWIGRPSSLKGPATVYVFKGMAGLYCA